MLWSKFQDQFHPSWENKIKPFIESSECDKIYAKLKEESRRGVLLAPLSNLTFRAFKETPLDECRAILIGLSPYHSFINGSSICDGLALSCGITGKMQPSLSVLLDLWERELYDGLALDRYKNPDLTYLAREEKILLINASLTVPKDKAGAHCSLWEPFMEYLLSEVVGYTGIPVVYLGKEAAKLDRYVTPFTHTFPLTHPSYFARISQEMPSEGAFKKVSQIIKQNNGVEVQWLQKIENVKEYD